MTADVHAQVAESRRAQGLPETITDPVLLTQLAAAILADEPATEGGEAA